VVWLHKGWLCSCATGVEAHDEAREEAGRHGSKLTRVDSECTAFLFRLIRTDSECSDPPGWMDLQCVASLFRLIRTETECAAFLFKLIRIECSDPPG